MGRTEQSRDGDVSRCYKYADDGSSNITAFTTKSELCRSCALGGEKKNRFCCPKACSATWLPRQLGFLGFEASPGQTCNFWEANPAAYVFLYQLLAAGSRCGPRDLTKVACGSRRASKFVLNVFLPLSLLPRLVLCLWWAELQSLELVVLKPRQISSGRFDIPSLFTRSSSSSRFSRMSWTMAFLWVLTWTNKEKQKHSDYHVNDSCTRKILARCVIASSELWGWRSAATIPNFCSVSVNLTELESFWGYLRSDDCGLTAKMGPVLEKWLKTGSRAK